MSWDCENLLDYRRFFQNFEYFKKYSPKIHHDGPLKDRNE